MCKAAEKLTTESSKLPRPRTESRPFLPDENLLPAPAKSRTWRDLLFTLFHEEERRYWVDQMQRPILAHGIGAGRGSMQGHSIAIHIGGA